MTRSARVLTPGFLINKSTFASIIKTFTSRVAAMIFYQPGGFPENITNKILVYATENDYSSENISLHL